MRKKRMSWTVLVLAAAMLCTPLFGCKEDSSQQQQQPEVSLTDQQKEELQDEAQDIVDKIMGNSGSDEDSKPDTTTDSKPDTTTDSTTSHTGSSETDQDESMQEGADIGAQINGEPSTEASFPDLLNEQRLALGLPALTPNDALMNAASMRIQEISFDRNLAFRHERPNGSRWESLFQESTDLSAPYGETILQGAADASVMLHAMLLSSEQKQQILSDHYTQIGYAFRDDLTAWVILLAA